MTEDQKDHKEILLVDDDSNYAELVRIRLEAAGYKVFYAANGREALEFLEKEDKPRLIIMDLDMPDKNGLTTLINMSIRRKGNEPDGKFDIPVVVATGFGGEHIRKIVMDQNISGYLRKPYQSEELLRTVKQLIG